MLDAPRIFEETYGEALSAKFSDLRFEKAVVFFEFYGPNSFAGGHIKETHEVTVFDIDVYKKGMLPPREFLEVMYGLKTPRLIHRGNITDDFIDDIFESRIEGVTFEGVVCKNKNHAFKIKSKAWLARLKGVCAGDMNKFKELA